MLKHGSLAEEGNTVVFSDSIISRSISKHTVDLLRGTAFVNQLQFSLFCPSAELVYDDVFVVWETIWAARHCASEHFVLFIALALLQFYR